MLQNHNLRDIAATNGFQRAFAEMATYTLGEDKEAAVHGFLEKGEPYYKVIFGLSDSMESASADKKKKYLSPQGSIIKAADFPAYGKEFLAIHTHPQNDEMEDALVYSETDLISTNTVPERPSGVFVLSCESKSRGLLWKPDGEYSPEMLREIYEEACAARSHNERAKAMGIYGLSEIVDFELANGIWQPAKGSVRKLEKFKIGE